MHPLVFAATNLEFNSAFLHGEMTKPAEPYSIEYPMEYVKWTTPKKHVLVK